MILKVLKIITLSIILSSELLTQTFHKEINLKNARELVVKVSAGLGSIVISKSKKPKVAVVNISTKKNLYMSDVISIHHSIDENIGYIDIEGTNLWSSNWNIELPDDLPISLNVELGLCKAVLDMSGLSIKAMKVSSGVSSTVVRFNKPNKIEMRKLEIETGASSFVGAKLGNARFRRLIFSGGAGFSTLDLDGDIKDNAEVNISLGVGNLTIKLPRDVGARVETSGFFSSHNLKDFITIGKGKYESINYDTANKRIRIYIETGFGNTTIRWKD